MKELEKNKENKKNKGKVGAPYGNKNCKGHKNAEKWTEEKALELGNELIEWMMPKIITKVDKNENEVEIDIHLKNIQVGKFILMVKGLHSGLIHRLCKKYESFADLYKRAQEIQEVKMFDLAIFAKKINPSGPIFFLKTVCGRNEKNMIEHSGGLKIESKLSFSDIDKKIDQSDSDV